MPLNSAAANTAKAAYNGIKLGKCFHGMLLIVIEIKAKMLHKIDMLFLGMHDKW